jgi:hypothetical protein
MEEMGLLPCYRSGSPAAMHSILVLYVCTSKKLQEYHIRHPGTILVVLPCEQGVVEPEPEPKPSRYNNTNIFGSRYICL